MPAAILDVDLRSFPPELCVDRRYPEALILIRLCGRPIGQVRLPVNEGRILAPDAYQALVRACGWTYWEQRLSTALGLTHDGLPEHGRPRCTVAVCTRERAGDLRRCLAAVSALPDDGQEVLVVDNAPTTEATRKVVENFPGIRYVLEDRPGLDVARNRALREAREEVVAFTDDDAVPDHGWLRGLARNFEDPLVLCVTGLTMPAELDTEAQDEFERESSFGRGFARRIFDASSHDPHHAAPMGRGVNMAVRRGILERLGAFDEALDAGTPTRSGGDRDLFTRVLAAGYRVVYDPAALVWHRAGRDSRALHAGNSGTWHRRLRRPDQETPGRSGAGSPAPRLGLVQGRPVPCTRPLRPAPSGATIASADPGRAVGMRARTMGLPDLAAEDGARVSGPEMSVVCPTHDRRDSVWRAMTALARQTVVPDAFEVIVVADGCTDDTVSRLRGATLPFRLVVLEQPALGQACARNTGAARATASILVFIDDDIEPVPSMLDAYLRAHRQHPDHLVLGCCPPVVTNDSSLFHIALRNWWHDHIQSVRRAGHRFTYRDMHSGNFSISASLFARANGFDTGFAGRSGEDYDFGARLLAMGVPFVFAQDAVGFHHDLTDLERSLSRARLGGRGDVLLGFRHPELRAGLPLATFRTPVSRVMRSLRDLAFRRPEVGDRVARALRAALAPLEAARLRSRFDALYEKLRAYWYCRGAAEELGSAGSLDALERFFDVATGVPELLDLDLSAGLGQAERTLDERRPVGARIRLAGSEVGLIPAQAGAEGLRGAHLRPLLADMAPQLLIALALEETREAGAWDRVFEGATPRARAPAIQTGISVLVAADEVADALASTHESRDSGGNGA